MVDHIPAGSHAFGRTTINDHGSAILGNNYAYGDTFNLDRATLFVLDNAAVAQKDLIAGIKRALEQERCKHYIPGSDHCNRIYREECTSSREATAPCKRRKLRHEPDNNVENESKEEVGYPASHAQTTTSGMSKDVAMSNTTAEMRVPTATYELLRIILRGLGLSEWVVSAVILSLTAGRDTPLQAILRLVKNVCNGTVVPVTSAVVKSVTRTLCSVFWRAPTELSGDCIAFIDVYGAECNVPLVYLASEKIFEGFLEMHYDKSSAKQFLVDHQYNIKISSRKLGYLGLLGWKVKLAALDTDDKLHMTIVYRVSSQSCLECLNRLTKCTQCTDFTMVSALHDHLSW